VFKTNSLMKFNQKHRAALALSLSALTLTGCEVLNDIPQAHGYIAKIDCSNIFISNQDPEESLKYFVFPEVSPINIVAQVNVDEEAGTVSSRDFLYGDKNKSVAVYRPGFGCTVMHDLSIQQLDDQTPDFLYTLTLPSDELWPHGTAGIADQNNNGVNYQAIETAIDNAFSPTEEKLTTSVLVIHQGKMIAERYREGFGPTVPVLGWSMSKSVTSSLVGVLSDAGALDVNASAPIDEWIGTDKEIITIDNLLQMAHGLKYSESSRGENADQAKMLYLAPSHADYMVERPLEVEPGTLYNYSTGSTALVSRVVQDAVGGSLSDAYEFYQTEFFHRIDIATAIVEHDTAGYFVGGAGVYMSPRDWARMGQLYLQNGIWNGDIILSQDWLNYAISPSVPNETIGASIFLNTNQQTWPSLPEDVYAFLGHNEQMVMIIPSEELVVVRTGTTFGGAEVSQKELLVATIIEALTP